VTTIRAFGREQHFAARYKAQTDNYNKVRPRMPALVPRALADR